jgi:hypothetical protein
LKKIEKLVNYLKWKKEKYRLGNIRIKSAEEVGKFLNINTTDFVFRSKRILLLYENLWSNGKFMQKLVYLEK